MQGYVSYYNWGVYVPTEVCNLIVIVVCCLKPAELDPAVKLLSELDSAVKFSMDLCLFIRYRPVHALTLINASSYIH